MKNSDKRLLREKKTIGKMARIYCRANHRTAKGLCSECRELLSYALERIDRCPYKDGKPACSACPNHCYETAMREMVRQVMRYAGPRMLVRHPLLALWHLMESRGARQRAPKK